MRPLSEIESGPKLEPESMQVRRFMWKEVDETMDDIIQGVANGAKVMKHMIDTAFSDPEPTLVRFKKNAEFRQSLPAVNSRYVLKKPPKTTRVVKIIPKKIVKVIPTKPLINVESLVKAAAQQVVLEPVRRPEDDFKIDEKTLRQIEREEEEKVEATISAILPNVQEEEIIVGKHKDDWKPVIPESTEIPAPIEIIPFSTKKPHVVSPLHTNVLNVTRIHTENKTHHGYEVTENVAEETIQRPHTSRPQSEKATRRKGSLGSEKYTASESKSRNHKNAHPHLSETSPSTSKPKAVASYQTSRKGKVKEKSKVDHSTTTPKSRTTRKENPSKSSTTTKGSNHHRLKSEKIKSNGNSTESPKQAKQVSSRGSVKFGDKV